MVHLHMIMKIMFLHPLSLMKKELPKIEMDVNTLNDAAVGSDGITYKYNRLNGTYTPIGDDEE